MTEVYVLTLEGTDGDESRVVGEYATLEAAQDAVPLGEVLFYFPKATDKPSAVLLATAYNFTNCDWDHYTIEKHTVQP